MNESQEHKLETEAGDGGTAARRAVFRWAWRMYRREWRQQIMIVGLLSLAIAATVVTAAAAYNLSAGQSNDEFGSANHFLIALGELDPQDTASLVAAAEDWFGEIEVIRERHVPVPGSVDPLEVRMQDPQGPFGGPLLALREGRYPSGAQEVAVTDGHASSFRLDIGSTFRLDGIDRTVVGIVENPSDLNADFALIAPSEAETADSITILVGGTAERFESFQPPGGETQFSPGDVPFSYMASTRAASEQIVSVAMVIMAGSVLLALVALVAAAGFVVMAQRRLRQLGMLGAIGGSEGHVRFVVLANGVIVGAVASVIGTVCGVAAWALAVPFLEPAVGYRIARFDVPWWLIATGAVLGVVTATAAAWWPARSIARIPIVLALSGRPSAPTRWRGPVAIAVLAIVSGVLCLAVTNGEILSNEDLDVRKALFTAGGLLATMLGVLLMSPLTIRALASTAPRMPVGARLALRDLARYQARSGFALAAISLALGMAISVVVIATAAQDSSDQGNLPSNQLLIWARDASRAEFGGKQTFDGFPSSPVNETSPELERMEAQTDSIANSLGGATVTALDIAIGSAADLRPEDRLLTLNRRIDGGYMGFSPVYLATPALLDQFGVDIDEIRAGTEIITSETGELFLLGGAAFGTERSSPQPLSDIQQLPRGYSSFPRVFITPEELERLGLSTQRVGWLIETSEDLTDEQTATARDQAAVAGLVIETRHDQGDISAWLSGTTVAGMLVALSVLAMTVGLIRAETARDLRTLTATGATSATRRTVTGVTAGALGLLGGLVGTAGAYTVMLAMNYNDVGALLPVPVIHLLAITIGLPLLAAVSGWILARGEPAGISRQPIT